MDQRNLNLDAIEKYLGILHKRLPACLTAVATLYEVPEQLALAAVRSNFSSESLQHLSDHIGIYLNILTPITISIQSEAGQGYSGLYRVQGGSQPDILLLRTTRHGIQNILAILIHEYTHHFLRTHNVRLEDDLENEYLTDIATAYLGLGHYVIPGYEPITWESDYWSGADAYGRTQHSVSVGYLTTPTIAAAIIMATPLRRWNPFEVLRKLPAWDFRLDGFLRLMPYMVVYSYRRADSAIHDKRRIRRELQLSLLRKELGSLQVLQDQVCIRKATLMDHPELAACSGKAGKRLVEALNEIGTSDLAARIGKVSTRLDTSSHIVASDRMFRQLRREISDMSRVLHRWFTILCCSQS
jgi:hypothetical protein